MKSGKMTISTLSKLTERFVGFFFTYWRDKIWNWASMGYSLATLSFKKSKLGIGNKVPRFRRHYDAIIKKWK